MLSVYQRKHVSVLLLISVLTFVIESLFDKPRDFRYPHSYFGSRVL